MDRTTLRTTLLAIADELDKSADHDDYDDDELVHWNRAHKLAADLYELPQSLFPPIARLATRFVDEAPGFEDIRAYAKLVRLVAAGGI